MDGQTKHDIQTEAAQLRGTDAKNAADEVHNFLAQPGHQNILNDKQAMAFLSFELEQEGLLPQMLLAEMATEGIDAHHLTREGLLQNIANDTIDPVSKAMTELLLTQFALWDAADGSKDGKVDLSTARVDLSNSEYRHDGSIVVNDGSGTTFTFKPDGTFTQLDANGVTNAFDSSGNLQQVETAGQIFHYDSSVNPPHIDLITNKADGSYYQYTDLQDAHGWLKYNSDHTRTDSTAAVAQLVNFDLTAFENGTVPRLDLPNGHVEFAADGSVVTTNDNSQVVQNAQGDITQIVLNGTTTYYDFAVHTINDLMHGNVDELVQNLQTKSHEDLLTIERLYQMQYGQPLKDVLQSSLSPTDWARVKLVLDQTDSTPNVVGAVDLALSKLAALPGASPSGWYDSLGGTTVDNSDLSVVQNLAGFTSRYGYMWSMNKYSGAQVAAEKQLCDSVAVLTSAQIDQLRVDFAATHNGLSFDDFIRDNSQLSPWTKAEMHILLKGTDHRSEDEVYALLNIGLNCHNLTIFEDAFAGTDHTLRQQLLTDHPDLGQRIDQVFFNDDNRAAHDYLNGGQNSAAAMIENDAQALTKNKDAILRDLQGMSEYDQEQFKKGWTLVEDYANMMLAQNSSYVRPNDRDLADQAIAFYRQEGNGTNDDLAALQLYRSTDRALENNGAYGVYDWERLSFEATVLFSEVPLLGDLRHFHADGVFGSGLGSSTDYAGIVARINQMNEAEWNALTGSPGILDENGEVVAQSAKDAASIRAYLRRELDSLGLSSEERENIDNLLKWKLDDAGSYKLSTKTSDILEAFTDCNYAPDVMLSSLMNMSLEEQQRYREARHSSDYQTNPNNFARKVDQALADHLPPDSIPNQISLNLSLDLANRYLADIMATPQGSEVHLDPVAQMLKDAGAGASALEMINDIRNYPYGSTLLNSWLSDPHNKATWEYIIGGALGRSGFTAEDYQTELQNYFSRTEASTPDIRSQNETAWNIGLITDLLTRQSSIPVEMLLAMSDDKGELFGSLRTVSAEDRSRILNDVEFQNRLFSGYSAEEKSLFLNTLRDEPGVISPANTIEAYILGFKSLAEVEAALTPPSGMSDVERANFIENIKDDFAAQYNTDMDRILLSRVSKPEENWELQNLLDPKPFVVLRDYLQLVDLSDSSYGGVDVRARQQEVRNDEINFKNLVIQYQQHPDQVSQEELKKASDQWVAAVAAYAEAKGATAEQVASLAIMAAAIGTTIIVTAATGGIGLASMMAILGAEGGALKVVITSSMEGSDFDSSVGSIALKFSTGAFEGALAALTPAEIARVLGIGSEAAATVVTNIFGGTLLSEAGQGAVEKGMANVLRLAWESGETITGKTVRAELAHLAGELSTQELNLALAQADQIAAALSANAPQLAEQGLLHAIDQLMRHGLTGASLGFLGGAGNAGLTGVFEYDNTRTFGDWISQVVAGGLAGAAGGAIMSVGLSGGRMLLTVAREAAAAEGAAIAPKVVFEGAQNIPGARLRGLVDNELITIEQGQPIPPGMTELELVLPDRIIGTTGEVIVQTQGQPAYIVETATNKQWPLDRNSGLFTSPDGLQAKDINGTVWNVIRNNDVVELTTASSNGQGTFTRSQSGDSIRYTDTATGKVYDYDATSRLFVDSSGNPLQINDFKLRALIAEAPTTMGAPADQTVALTNQAMQQFPGGVPKDSRVVVARTLDDYRPELADMPVPGQPGKTFKDVSAFYDPTTKTIVILDGASANAVTEELWHALDHSWQDFSGSSAFREMYSLDTINLEHLPPETRAQLDYVGLTNIVGGDKEAFAMAGNIVMKMDSNGNPIGLTSAEQLFYDNFRGTVEVVKERLQYEHMLANGSDSNYRLLHLETPDYMVGAPEEFPTVATLNRTGQPAGTPSGDVYHDVGMFRGTDPIDGLEGIITSGELRGGTAKGAQLSQNAGPTNWYESEITIRLGTSPDDFENLRPDEYSSQKLNWFGTDGPDITLNVSNSPIEVIVNGTNSEEIAERLVKAQEAVNRANAARVANNLEPLNVKVVSIQDFLANERFPEIASPRGDFANEFVAELASSPLDLQIAVGDLTSTMTTSEIADAVTHVWADKVDEIFDAVRAAHGDEAAKVFTEEFLNMPLASQVILSEALRRGLIMGANPGIINRLLDNFEANKPLLWVADDIAELLKKSH